MSTDRNIGASLPDSLKEGVFADTINVRGMEVSWDTRAGTCNFRGIPVAMMWVDSTLAGLMAGMEAMVGPDRFNLALQAEGRKSVESDWLLINAYPDFAEGFAQLNLNAKVAGWGDWQLVSYDLNKRECIFRAYNNWEGGYQKALGVCWGSGMLAGKLAGICGKLFDTNCWSMQTHFVAKGDGYDEFVVAPSVRELEHEIETLLESDQATRADMAIALRKLQHTQEILWESERRYEQLVSKVPDGIYTFRFQADGAMNFMFVSPRFCELLGLDAQAVLQDHRLVFALVHPDDLERLHRENDMARTTLCSFRWEGRFLIRGETRWMHISSDPTPLSDGGSLWHGVVSDITRRKLIERSLQVTADRLKEAQHIARIGSWELDLISGELVWSDEIFRIFEIDPAKFGATYEAFLNSIHPEDRDAVNKAYTDSLANRTPYDINHRLLMGDGRIKLVHEQCKSEFDAEGKPLRSMGTVQDVTSQQLALKDLHQANQLLDSIVKNIPAMIFMKRADDLRFELFNRAGEDLVGYSASDLLGKNDYDLFPKEQADFFTSLDREVLASGGIVDIPEEKITNSRRETRYLHTRKVVLRDLAGMPSHLLGISNDITAHKKAEEELRIAAAAFESLESIIVTDAMGVILRVNKAFTQTTGYTADEIVGQNPRMLQSGRHDTEFYREMWQSIHDKGGWQGEIWDRRKDGTVYPKWLTISSVKDEMGGVTHYVGTFLDITERKRAEDKIRELAFFDQLTGLPNRTLLLDRLKQAMAASSRSGRYGALLFIDLDNFKALNDTLGHDQGDLLLKQVAQRLASCVREGDTVARFGGDEFAVVLGGLAVVEEETAGDIEVVTKKILAALGQPYQFGNTTHRSTASLGVALFKGDSPPIEELMKQADLAMYKSKDAGRNTFHYFDPTLEARVKERVALEEDLRLAVHAKQLLLHYQPLVVDAGRLRGAEALVRWRHPTRGIVSPAAFIPLAEETGLILPLGEWVLETACSQLATWASQPKLADLTVAVNVSALQFHQSNFVNQVLDVIKRTGANPQRLKLELTESLLVENVEDIIEKMFALKAKGVGFSLDDFGTGYSSLSYLKRLPLGDLKIDQSFVRDVLIDPNDAAIARTIIALAQNLGLGVIAEGVETEAQRDFLARSGCHAYQGYFFSRPLPLEEFEQLIKEAE